MDKWIELNKCMLNLAEFRRVKKPQANPDRGPNSWCIKLCYKLELNKRSDHTINCSNKDAAETLYNKIKSTLLGNPIYSGKFLS